MPDYIKVKREEKKFYAKKNRKRKENGVLIKIPILNMILKQQNQRQNKLFSLSFALMHIMHSTIPDP